MTSKGQEFTKYPKDLKQERNYYIHKKLLTIM